MQDDYNRFIKRSIRQAQCNYAQCNYAPCNYEDIFADTDSGNSCGCMGTMGDTDMKDSCDCMGTMGDTDMKDSCGCMGTMGDTDMKDSCGCGTSCKPMCDKNVQVMAFVEMQPFGRIYNEAEGLCRGTLFPSLDKPFTGRGGCR